MRRLAWTFAARIGDKYQIRLTRSNYNFISSIFFFKYKQSCSLPDIINEKKLWLQLYPLKIICESRIDPDRLSMTIRALSLVQVNRFIALDTIVHCGAVSSTLDFGSRSCEFESQLR